MMKIGDQTDRKAANIITNARIILQLFLNSFKTIKDNELTLTITTCIYRTLVCRKIVRLNSSVSS